MSFLQGVDKEATEAAAQDAHGEEEAAAASDPGLAIGSQSAAGNHAVQMRMEVKILPPGMEHTEESGRSAEMLGIGGDGEKRLRGGAEENLLNVAQ